VTVGDTATRQGPTGEYEYIFILFVVHNSAVPTPAVPGFNFPPPPCEEEGER